MTLFVKQCAMTRILFLLLQQQWLHNKIAERVLLLFYYELFVKVMYKKACIHGQINNAALLDFAKCF